MDFVVQESKPDVETSIWVEKYRPKKLDDFVGNNSVKEKFEHYIERKDIPHILLFGSAGTGKTSLAKIVIRNIPCDKLVVNASAERGIDLMRDKISDFASGCGFQPLKIVVLDEADALTGPAQSSFRNMMETFAAHTRFILTCNYPEQIIDPISSRLQAFEIKPPSKKDVAVRLAHILQSEKVSFTQDDIVFIVNTFYPDLRKSINFAQQSNVEGALKIRKENAFECNALLKIVELLKTPSKSGVFDEIRKLTLEIDPVTMGRAYRFLMDNVSDFAKGKEALVVLELADGLHQSSLVIPVVKDIPFLACVYKILKHLK